MATKKNENLHIAALTFGGFLLMGILFLCLTDGREFLDNRGYALRDDHFAILAVTIFGGAYGFIANKIMKIVRRSNPTQPKS